MEKKNLTYVAVIALSAMLFSCQKDLERPTMKPGPNGAEMTKQSHSKKFTVSTTSQLYAAVNDPGNAGAQIVLEPGTYVLDGSYPNAGRLELQADMSLSGQSGHVEAVVIDQSGLPINSFRLTPTTSTGGIRIGRGSNSIEWLSIKGGDLAVNPFSVIEADLTATQTTVHIAHVKIDCNGSRIGIMLRNRLSEHADRVIKASLKDVEIFGAVNSPGAGLSLQNRISGSAIQLDMQGSYIHDNKIGILQFHSGLGNTVENCTTEIVSIADRIEGNGCGIDPSGGTNGSGATYANNNLVTIQMTATSLRYNNPVGRPELVPTNGALPSAVYVAGGYNSLNNIVAYNHVNSNKVTLEFTGCNISNNNGTDIYAYGAWSPPLALLAGTNNVVNLYLRGISAGAIVEAANSVPYEPGGTNVVNVYRN